MPAADMEPVRLARGTTSSNRQYRCALRTVDGFLSGTIARARRKGSPPGTLLSLLLDTYGAEGNRQMSDGELHDELKIFLVAGHTTTASVLACVWYALAGKLGSRKAAQAGTARGSRGAVSRSAGSPCPPAIVPCRVSDPGPRARACSAHSNAVARLRTESSASVMNIELRA
jgi:cytochrome P450